MRKPTSFCIQKRIKSFYYAINGIKTMILTEHNAWIHAAATIAVVLVGFIVGVTRYEWCWLVLAIISVWTAETINTAFEFLADVASPEFHPLVEKAKDVAAGAVLITATGAFIIGILIFWPYIKILYN